MSLPNIDVETTENDGRCFTTKSDIIGALQFDKMIKCRTYSYQFTLNDRILVAVNRQEEYKPIEDGVTVDVDICIGFCDDVDRFKSNDDFGRLSDMTSENGWLLKMINYDSFDDKDISASIGDYVMDPNKLYLVKHKSISDGKPKFKKPSRITQSQFNESDEINNGRRFQCLLQKTDKEPKKEYISWKDELDGLHCHQSSPMISSTNSEEQYTGNDKRPIDDFVKEKNCVYKDDNYPYNSGSDGTEKEDTEENYINKFNSVNHCTLDDCTNKYESNDCQERICKETDNGLFEKLHSLDLFKPNVEKEIYLSITEDYIDKKEPKDNEVRDTNTKVTAESFKDSPETFEKKIVDIKYKDSSYIGTDNVDGFWPAKSDDETISSTNIDDKGHNEESYILQFLSRDNLMNADYLVSQENMVLEVIESSSADKLNENFSPFSKEDVYIPKSNWMGPELKRIHSRENDKETYEFVPVLVRVEQFESLCRSILNDLSSSNSSATKLNLITSDNYTDIVEASFVENKENDFDESEQMVNEIESYDMEMKTNTNNISKARSNQQQFSIERVEKFSDVGIPIQKLIFQPKSTNPISSPTISRTSSSTSSDEQFNSEEESLEILSIKMSMDKPLQTIEKVIKDELSTSFESSSQKFERYLQDRERKKSMEISGPEDCQFLQLDRQKSQNQNILRHGDSIEDIEKMLSQHQGGYQHHRTNEDMDNDEQSNRISDEEEPSISGHYSSDSNCQAASSSDEKGNTIERQETYDVKEQDSRYFSSMEYTPSRSPDDEKHMEMLNNLETTKSLSNQKKPLSERSSFSSHTLSTSSDDLQSPLPSGKNPKPVDTVQDTKKSISRTSSTSSQTIPSSSDEDDQKNIACKQVTIAILSSSSSDSCSTSSEEESENIKNKLSKDDKECDEKKPAKEPAFRKVSTINQTLSSSSEEHYSTEIKSVDDLERNPMSSSRLLSTGKETASTNSSCSIDPIYSSSDEELKNSKHLFTDHLLEHESTKEVNTLQRALKYGKETVERQTSSDNQSRASSSTEGTDDIKSIYIDHLVEIERAKGLNMIKKRKYMRHHLPGNDSINSSSDEDEDDLSKSKNRMKNAESLQNDVIAPELVNVDRNEIISDHSSSNLSIGSTSADYVINKDDEDEEKKGDRYRRSCTLPTHGLHTNINIKERSKSLERPINIETDSFPDLMDGCLSVIERKYHEYTETWSSQPPNESKSLSKIPASRLQKKFIKKTNDTPRKRNSLPLTKKPRPVPSYLSPVNAFPYKESDEEFSSNDSIINDYNSDNKADEIDTRSKSIPDFINALSHNKLMKASPVNKRKCPQIVSEKSNKERILDLNYGAEEDFVDSSKTNVIRQGSLTSITTISSYLERPLLSERPKKSNLARLDSFSSFSLSSQSDNESCEVKKKENDTNSYSLSTSAESMETDPKIELKNKQSKVVKSSDDSIKNNVTKLTSNYELNFNKFKLKNAVRQNSPPRLESSSSYSYSEEDP